MVGQARPYFIHLDFFRGVAACVVVLEHWRNLFFCDYAAIPRANPAQQVLYLASGLGHEAVMVFFVLSGFVISNSIFTAYERMAWSWRKYLTDRLTRLWVVLLPALSLGVLWDLSGIGLHGSGGLYQGAQFGHILLTPVAASISPVHFIGNALFLQTIVISPLGSNGPLWSLANEFWYYLCFPLMVVAMRDANRPWIRVFNGLLSIGLLCFVGPSIAVMYLIWLMGVLTYFAFKRWRIRSKRTARLLFFVAVIGLLGVLGGIRWEWLLPSRPLLGNCILGSVVAITMYAALQLEGPRPDSLYAFTAKSLSKVSYSLYLLHLPLLVWLASFFFSNNRDRWLPDWKHFTYGLGLLALVALYVKLVYAGTEAHTAAVRAWVHRVILKEACDSSSGESITRRK